MLNKEKGSRGFEASPPASSPSALARMKSQKQRDTKPEIELRSCLHTMGYRFRTDMIPIPGMKTRADIAFPRVKVAIFVDGCFWHSCPKHGTMPKQNSKWWQQKLAANSLRDRETDDRLGRAGWTVVRIWEHEKPSEAAKRVVAILEKRYATLNL